MDNLVGTVQKIEIMCYPLYMNFLIASDIHGSEDAARRISELYHSGEFDNLLLLGDLLYHGPRNDLPQSYNPKAVIAILSELKDHIIAVRGNCEAEVDQMVLPFPVLAETAIIFADSLRIFATHGHIYTPEKHPEGIDAFFYGHTHIPELEKRNGVIYLNPGSVSIPKGGFTPSYAVYSSGEICIKALCDNSTMFSLRGMIE